MDDEIFIRGGSDTQSKRCKFAIEVLMIDISHGKFDDARLKIKFVLV